ncbi:MAG TPA: 6-carboxytetrahydropterin synthase [Bacteroidales bacterium]|jgi:6-pyruvoyltetrahydropterin/6-carboxytetrahydropterin synthase|nr:6-carboxytetrahydropterin synthase [Bacteroidales bacterium]
MASVIRVTKEFHFEMAHVLLNYDGPCRNVHGHSYRLFVTISGIPVSDPSNPKNGMVIDFTDLKKIIKAEILTVFDHSIVVSHDFFKGRSESFTSLFGNVVTVDYQPTCENLVSDFAGRISRRLPSGINLHSLKLYETATSYAEWFAADNNAI